jgi:hypothetical protein
MLLISSWKIAAAVELFAGASVSPSSRLGDIPLAGG